MWLQNVVITLKCCRKTWRISREEHMKPYSSYYIDVLSSLQNIEQNGSTGWAERNVISTCFGDVIMVYLTPQAKVFTVLI
jgi:hypothetical protein